MDFEKKILALHAIKEISQVNCPYYIVMVHSGKNHFYLKMDNGIKCIKCFNY